jgi:Fe-S-cluster containining protein
MSDPTDDVIERFSREQLPEFKRLLGPALKDIVQSKAPMAEKFDRLEDLTDRVGALIHPYTPCRKGCSGCCYQAVTISQHEAERIARATGANFVPRERTLVQMLMEDGPEALLSQQQQYIDRYKGVVCSFLGEDGACTIYEDRPLPCRSHHTIHPTAELCDLKTNMGRTIPSFDITRLWSASAEVLFESDFADIREWFPDGSNTRTSAPGMGSTKRKVEL